MIIEGVVQGISNVIEAISRGSSRVIGRIRYSINPLNWIMTGSETSQGFKTFMDKQNVMETAERSLYPFTKINPYLPWYEQLKINLFGESVVESLKRFKALEYADRTVNSLAVKGKHIDIRGVSPALTPNVWYESGIGTPIPKLSFADVVQGYNVQSKLSHLPPTPTMNPTVLPLSEILPDVSEWKTFEKSSFTETTDNWLKDWKGGKAGSSHNRYSVLDID